MNICICITDSLCYKAETNTIVKQLCSNKDVKKKRIKSVPPQQKRSKGMKRISTNENMLMCTA